MKKTLIVLLSLVMILALVSGCTADSTGDTASQPDESASVEGSPTDPPSEEGAADENHEPVTIEMLGWGFAEGVTGDAFDEMIAGFEAKYPWITVEKTESNYDAVQNTLLTRAAANDAPDVAQVSNQWVAPLYEMEALLPVDELLSSEAMSTFYEGAKAGTTIDGKTYSAPWLIQAICMYYNKDLLEAAGYSEPPTTWDEYIQMCYDIAALGTNSAGNTIYGRTFSSSVQANTGYFSLIDLWANGADVIDADGNVVLYSDGTVEAYQELRDMADENVFAPGLQIVDNRNLFANNQVGFHFDVSAMMGNFADVNYGVVQVPGGVSFSSDHHLVAFKDTEHPEECGLLIDYLSGPEGMAIYTSHTGVIGSRTTVAEIDYYKSLDDNMMIFFDAAAVVRSLPVQSSNFLPAMEAVAEGIQRIIINTEDVDTVIKDVDTEIKELYEN